MIRLQQWSERGNCPISKQTNDSYQEYAHPMSQIIENNVNLSSESRMLADQCPAWAIPMIQRILVLEVELGTIKNPALGSDDPNWSTASLENLTKVASRLDRERLDNIEEEVQALFGRISRGLAGEGHSHTEIAHMINSRVPTGCNLPYCNAQEVAEACSN
jgi:hypothetical protein